MIQKKFISLLVFFFSFSFLNTRPMWYSIQADLVQKTKTKTINYYLKKKKRQHPTKIANIMYKFQYSRRLQQEKVFFSFSGCDRDTPLKPSTSFHSLFNGSTNCPRLTVSRALLKAPSESKLVCYWRLGISFSL